MSLTLEQAQALKPGDILVDILGKRWKVSGQVQRWKKDRQRVRVPLKHGLYAHDAITERDFINGVNEHLTMQDKETS